MNAVNPVQLLILGWTFTAVCQADDDISVICEDVTGTVGEEVTLTCSVSLSLKCTNNCIKVYKFKSPTTYNASKICKLSADSCERRNSFTCRFTPTTAMTEQFRFFVQTPCGTKTPEFTVTITERSTPEPVTEDPETTKAGPGSVIGDSPGSNNTVIAAVVGCFIIIIIIITMTIIYKTKSHNTILCGFKRMFLGRRHDEDNSNGPEDMI